ncbi:hypothetical protein VE04_09783, partial [Pseudogymnoascus sp. 24MN13]
MAPASVATPLPASAASCTDPEGAGHSQPGTATGKPRPIPPALMPVIPAYRLVHAAWSNYGRHLLRLGRPLALALV